MKVLNRNDGLLKIKMYRHNCHSKIFEDYSILRLIHMKCGIVFIFNLLSKLQKRYTHKKD